MRILITTGIFPPDIGGPATYVPEVARALSGRDHDVTVVTLSDSLGHDDSRYPFRVLRLRRRIFKPWRILRTVVNLVTLGERADVLFVNGLAMEAVLANLVLRKPLVQKVVGDFAWERATTRSWVRDSFEDFQKNRYSLKVEALRALRAWWIREADWVIVPCRYLESWVQGLGVPETKISIIYNAVEIPNRIEAARLPLRTPTKIIIITVCRLIPVKRVEQIIRIVALLDGAGLVIVGDGPDRGRLERLVSELGVVDRVFIAGERTSAETLGLMASCDLFVLNSSHEGFPHVLLEAMSLGLPVIATAVGGIPEVVKDGQNGLLVSPSNSETLYSAVSNLLTSMSERQLLGDGARQTVKSLSFARMVAETEGLLHTLSIRGTPSHLSG